MAWIHELTEGPAREPESDAGTPSYALGTARDGRPFLLVLTFPEGRGPNETGAGSKQQMHFSADGVEALERAISEFKRRFADV